MSHEGDIMKRDFSKILILIAIITLCISVPVRAQDEDTTTQDATTDQDDLGVSRVGRLSYIQGDVSFLRSGEKDWAYASENLPLLAGDQVYTAKGARAEIQLGRDSYIRLSENTAFSMLWRSSLPP